MPFDKRRVIDSLHEEFPPCPNSLFIFLESFHPTFQHRDESCHSSGHLPFKIELISFPSSRKPWGSSFPPLVSYERISEALRWYSIFPRLIFSPSCFIHVGLPIACPPQLSPFRAWSSRGGGILISTLTSSPLPSPFIPSGVLDGSLIAGFPRLPPLRYCLLS